MTEERIEQLVEGLVEAARRLPTWDTRPRFCEACEDPAALFLYQRELCRDCARDELQDEGG